MTSGAKWESDQRYVEDICDKTKDIARGGKHKENTMSEVQHGRKKE
jgi:hypothetical protein